MKQLYLLYTSTYGDTSGWKTSIQKFINFIASDVLGNAAYSSQFDTKTASMLKNIKDIINGNFVNNLNGILRYFSIDEIYTLLESKFTIEELFYRYYLEEDGDRELIDVLCKYGKSDRINYSIKKYYIKVKLKK